MRRGRNLSVRSLNLLGEIRQLARLSGPLHVYENNRTILITSYIVYTYIYKKNPSEMRTVHTYVYVFIDDLSSDKERCLHSPPPPVTLQPTTTTSGRQSLHYLHIHWRHRTPATNCSVRGRRRTNTRSDLSGGPQLVFLAQLGLLGCLVSHVIYTRYVCI